MTQIYLRQPKQAVWSLPKFLSRGIWCVDQVATTLSQEPIQVSSRTRVWCDWVAGRNARRHAPISISHTDDGTEKRGRK